MAKRKEIKWRWEARGTMIGRQNGIIFRIYHPWDMPEREHTVSCYDTKRAGRTISTARVQEIHLGGGRGVLPGNRSRRD